MIEGLETDLERGEYLQNLLIAHSTGGDADNGHYKLLRSHFMNQEDTRALIPSFIKTNRDLFQFWPFIKYKFSTYADRRTFIYSEFGSLLDFLEGKTPAPADNTISNGLKDFSAESVHSAWSKALARIIHEEKENHPFNSPP